MQTQPCNLEADIVRELMYDIEKVLRQPNMRQTLGPMLYDSLMRDHEQLRHHLYHLPGGQNHG